MLTKTVTLVGRGPSWKECLFNTEELWGTESCLITDGLKDKKYTKVFSFDDNDIAKQCALIAKERHIPFVSSHEYATEPFPMIEIAREFGSSYFMPTISFMIAYALYLKYDCLSIFGIDQGLRWDYQAGKPHVTFWLGVATGRKVNLRIGRGSLRWAYMLGLNELPLELFEGEENSIANHIGLSIRQEEILLLEKVNA